jgi:hypothetical protein
VNYELSTFRSSTAAATSPSSSAVGVAVPVPPPFALDFFFFFFDEAEAAGGRVSISTPVSVMLQRCISVLHGTSRRGNGNHWGLQLTGLSPQIALTVFHLALLLSNRLSSDPGSRYRGLSWVPSSLASSREAK